MKYETYFETMMDKTRKIEERMQLMDTTETLMGMMQDHVRVTQ